MLWIVQMDMRASEVGASAGPGAGLSLMLLAVGRSVALGWFGYELLHYLWP